nr:MAG: hypothetical protein DIU66_07480 [Bacillota bacterium]
MNKSTYHVLIDTLFQLFTDEEMVRLAQQIKPVVPGFSTKNYSRVPKPLLRAKLIEKIRKEKPDKWLANLVRKWTAKYEGKEPKVFCWSIKLDAQLSRAEKVALFAYLYPEIYSSYHNVILSNVQQGCEPLEGLFSEPSSAQEKMEIIKSFLLQGVDSNKLLIMLKKKLEGVYDRLRDVEDDLQSVMLSDISWEPGVFLYLYLKRFSQWKTWSDPGKALFCELCLYDALHLLNSVSDKIHELEREFEEKYKLMREELEERTRALEASKTAIEEYKEAINQWKEKAQEWERKEVDYRALIEQWERAYHDLQLAQNELRQHVEELAASRQQQSDCISRSLLAEDPIVLITLQNNELYEAFLTPSQYWVLTSSDDLLSRLDPVVMNDKIVFVVIDGFETERLLKAQMWFQRHGIRYRFVGSDPKKVIKKIISFVGGM